MGKYKVKAKDQRSAFISDTIEAQNQREVIDILHRRGLTVLGIEEIREKTRRSFMDKKVRISELSIFGRQLATMVNAGLPLIDALRVLQDQVEHIGFKKVILDIVQKVEGGNSFTDAIASHPRIFGSFFINMVRAGEASGKLAEILIRIADYLESVSSLRRKVVMAMLYPGIISVMTVLITLVLFLKVIPVFETIYIDFGGQLPMPTQILITASKLLRQWFWIVLIFTVVFFVVLFKFKKTAKGRAIFDKLQLKIPIFGTLFHKVAISRFSKTLGTLIKSGVPIISALEIVKEVAGNKQIEDAVIVATDRIREGKSIEEPLHESGIFPKMVVKMIAVGEKSGRLDEMLEKVSDYYDEQVATMVAGLANLIEPLLIAFLGVVVGGIVLCMFLPIFRLSTIITS